MTRSPRRLAAVGLCLLLFAPLAACGNGTGADVAAPPGVSLPEVGTLGRVPRGPGAIDVVVTAEGRITLGGKGPLSLVDLREELQRLTADPRWMEPDRSSMKTLLIYADRDLPWSVTVWIMMVAAEPTVSLPRIFFGARSRPDGHVGALGTALPRDGKRYIDWDAEPPPRLKVNVLPTDGAASRPEELFDHLVATAGDEPISSVTVDLRPVPGQRALPHGFMVQLLGMALRAGVERFEFWGAPLPKAFDPADAEGLLEHVAELRRRMGNPVLRRRGAKPDEALPPQADLPAPRGRLPYLLGSGVERVERQPSDSESEREPSAEVLQEEERIDGEDTETDTVIPFEETQKESLADAPFPGPASHSAEPYQASRSATFAGRRAPAKDAEPALGVPAALAWLTDRQLPNGGWEISGGPRDVGSTGLALAAFLGAGRTNRGRHAHARTVSKGLRHLKNAQDAEGCFGPRVHPREHALATLAMVEVYGMTRSPFFKGSALKAVEWLARIDVDTSDPWLVLPLVLAARIDADAVASDRTPPFRLAEDLVERALRRLDTGSTAGLYLLTVLARGDAVAPESLPAPAPGDPDATFWHALALDQDAASLLRTQRRDGSWDPRGVRGSLRTTALAVMGLTAARRYVR